MSKDRFPKHAIYFEQLESRLVLTSTPISLNQTPAWNDGYFERVPTFLNDTLSSSAPASHTAQNVANALAQAPILNNPIFSAQLSSGSKIPTPYRIFADAPTPNATTNFLGTNGPNANTLGAFRDNGLLVQSVFEAAFLSAQRIASGSTNQADVLSAEPGSADKSIFATGAETTFPILRQSVVSRLENLASDSNNEFQTTPVTFGGPLATTSMPEWNSVQWLSNFRQQIDGFFAQLQNGFPRSPLASDSVLAINLPNGIPIPPFRPGFGPFAPGGFLLGELRSRIANLNILDDILSAMSSDLSAFETVSVMPGSMVNRIPDLNPTTSADLSGPGTSIGSWRVGMEVWLTTVNNSLSSLIRIAGYRIGSLPLGPLSDLSPRRGPVEPPLSPKVDEPLPGDPILPSIESDNVKPERIAARLVGVLGRGSILSPRIVELAIRKLIEDIHAAEQTVTEDAFDSGLTPWLVSVALAALACESGRRQMRRNKLRAEHDDAGSELRDLLFLNLGHDYD